VKSHWFCRNCLSAKFYAIGWRTLAMNARKHPFQAENTVLSLFIWSGFFHLICWTTKSGGYPGLLSPAVGLINKTDGSRNPPINHQWSYFSFAMVWNSVRLTSLLLLLCRHWKIVSRPPVFNSFSSTFVCKILYLTADESIKYRKCSMQLPSFSV
jgi:hypothetical protein